MLHNSQYVKNNTVAISPIIEYVCSLLALFTLAEFRHCTQLQEWLYKLHAAKKLNLLQSITVPIDYIISLNKY